MSILNAAPAAVQTQPETRSFADDLAASAYQYQSHQPWWTLDSATPPVEGPEVPTAEYGDDDATWVAEQNDADSADAEPPAAPTTALLDYVLCQAAWFRSFGTEAGDLIAEQIETLANGVKATDASTPAEYRGRVAELDRWAAYDEWDRAERQGYERGCRDACR
jgi:hypothetical protein